MQSQKQCLAGSSKYAGKYKEENMTAQIRLSGSLRDVTGGKEENTVESGFTIRETLVSLGIQPLTVALVMVNDEQSNKDYVIQDGDKIRVMAVVGGG